MVLALAAWVIVLGERFHDAGTVPMVYIHLIFGTAILANWLGHAVGIFFGYMFGAGREEG